MNTYSWNAQDYERNSQAQQKWGQEVITKLNLKGTENILDLGCGDGKITVEIAELVSHGSVIGVDNSSQMIALAYKKYSQNQYPNLSFQVMDASALYALILSFNLLHW